MNKRKTEKLISVFLCMALAFSMFPAAFSETAAAAGPDGGIAPESCAEDTAEEQTPGEEAGKDESSCSGENGIPGGYAGDVTADDDETDDQADTGGADPDTEADSGGCPDENENAGDGEDEEDDGENDEEDGAFTAPEEGFLRNEIPDDFCVPFAEDTELSALSDYLPSSYDSREAGFVSSVKDQQGYQLCWAFSAAAVAESNLLSKGCGEADLSEMHLGYYFDGYSYDPLGNASGDGTYFTGGDYLSSGNNNKFTTFALMNWTGLANETSYPYDTAYYTGTDRSVSRDDVFHISSVKWINAGDTSTVKQYIIANGSVGISYYYAKRFLNTETSAYYNDTYSSTNHAVSLVGWDDDYDVSNFNADTAPSGNGAWLVKDSRGTDVEDGGYFWLSYEDLSICSASSTVFLYECEPADNYDCVYYYDGSCGTKTDYVESGGKIAAVFKANGSSGGYDELLESVSFAIADAGCSYSIQIYKDLENETVPESGLPAFDEPVTGSLSLCGYHTVRLPSPVRLSSGEKYSVVITLYSDSGTVLFFVDKSYENGGWIKFVSSVGARQTFLKTPYGSSWSDLNTRTESARIKAYTSITDRKSVTYLGFGEKKVELGIGEEFTQQPTARPEGCSEFSIVWSSSNRTAATVDSSGKVTAKGSGSTEIKARIEDSTVSAAYTVSVIPVESILFEQEPVVTAGQETELQARILPEKAASHYSIEYTSSDNDTAVVEGSVLKALKAGNVIVTAKAGGISAELEFSVLESLEGAQVTAADAVFTAKPATTEVMVSLNGKKLESGRDYTLSYSGNTAPGTAMVTATGTGLYYGEAVAEFNVSISDTEVENIENKANGIAVSWDQADGVSGYRIYRSVNSRKYARIAILAGEDRTSYLDKGASSSGSIYSYRVEPYVKCKTRNYCGNKCAEVCICRVGTPGRCRVYNGTPFKIKWTKISSADYYQIYRSAGTDGYSLLETVQKDVLEYTDSSTVPGTEYRYRVSAVISKDTEYESSPSPTATVMIPEKTAVSSLSPHRRGIKVGCDAVDGAHGYYLFRSIDGGKWNRVKSIKASAMSSGVTDPVLRYEGRRVSYRIQSWTKYGSATLTGEMSETSDTVILANEVIKSVKAVNGSIVIKLGANKTADGYLLYRAADGNEELIADIGGDLPLSFTDMDIARGSVYTYRAVAYRTVDGIRYYSASGNEKSVRPR